MRIHGGIRLAATTATAALALALPATAGASTASVSLGNSLTYTAASGEANDASIVFDGVNTYTITDIVSITPLAGCNAVAGNPMQVTCQPTGVLPIQDLTATLGDMNDTLVLAPSVSINSSVSGAAGNDQLTGGSGQDSITGGDDADGLKGGAGGDSLDGGNGDDTLDGQGGGDDMNGGANTADGDTVVYDRPTGAVVTATVNSPTPAGEQNEGDGLSNVENLSGGLEQDNFTGDAASNRLSGGDGNDTLAGKDGIDGLDGGGGNDTFDETSGGAANGADDIVGAGGTGDAVTYAGRSGAVTVDLQSNGSNQGAGESDTIHDDVEHATGGSGADTLSGNTAANTLTGGGGNDTLRGRGGSDTLNGGGNSGDTATYDDAPAPVQASLRTGIATGDGSDVLQGIKFLTGSSFDDTLSGDSGTNTIDGGGAVDTIDYSGAAGPVTVDLTGSASGDGTDTLWNLENVTGSPAGDQLTGSAAANVLVGLGGDDSLTGRLGDDTLDGGNGSDTAVYDDRTTAAVTLDLSSGTGGEPGETDTFAAIENATGGGGADTLTGAGGDNRMKGGGGADSISGLGGKDEIYGDDGDDNTLSGGTDDDLVDGGKGDDSAILGGQGNDVLHGGVQTAPADPGDDSMDGGGGVDTVSYSERASTEPIAAVLVDSGSSPNNGVDLPTAENDTITNVENLTGGLGADTLTGNGADNVLEGDPLNGNGNDTLDGKDGIDTVTYAGRPGDLRINLGTTPTDPGEAPSGKGGETAAGEADSLVNLENAIGGSGADVISGSSLDNTLAGGPGADTLRGYDGNDTFDEGAASNGGDRMVGGNGNDDTVDYSARTVGVNADLSDSATGNDGAPSEADKVEDTVENAKGGAGGDTLTGKDAADNELTGNGGADTFVGKTGNDSLNGGPGDDTFDEKGDPATADSDTISGGTGSETAGDTVDYDARTTGVQVDLSTNGTGDGRPAENDDVQTDVENAQSGAGSDTLTGNSGVNRLDGGAGDDAVNGKAGGDALIGGTGGETNGDRADFADAPGAITASLAGGTATGDGSDTLATVENLTGGPSGDTLTGDANANKLDGAGGDDSLRGGGGADALTGGTGGETNGDTADFAGAPGVVTASLTANTATGDGSDTLATVENLTGGSLGDTLTGDATNNKLDGAAGDDTLRGGAGDDALTGGSGGETNGDTADFVGAPGAVTASLLAGTATGHGSDTLTTLENLAGSANGDTLTGNTGANRLDGADGDDSLKGGGGPDKLNGGANGSAGDTADYGDHAQPVAADLDAATGDDGSSEDGSPSFRDTVAADVENLTGGPNGDTLTGDGGANALLGGAGADTLTGGLGADVLGGGAGADDLQIRDEVADTATCDADADTVTADALDVVNADCETVDRGSTGGGTPNPAAPPPPPPPPPPADSDGDGIADAQDCAPADAARPARGGPDANCNGVVDSLEIAPDTTRPAIGLTIRLTVFLAANGEVPVRVRCPASERSCTGTVVLDTAGLVQVSVRRRVRLGSRGYRLAGGTARTVRVRLSPRNRALVARLRRVRVRATVTARDAAGNRTTRRRVFTLAARR